MRRLDGRFFSDNPLCLPTYGAAKIVRGRKTGIPETWTRAVRFGALVSEIPTYRSLSGRLTGLLPNTASFANNLAKPVVRSEGSAQHLLRANAEGLVQFGGTVQIAIFDDQFDFSNLTDVARRIAIDQDEVRVLSRRDGT
jgi:hypothetical protein